MAGQGESEVRGRPKSSSSLLPRVSVSELMEGGREAVLVHDSIEYRLRLTSNGKLILDQQGKPHARQRQASLIAAFRRTVTPARFIQPMLTLKGILCSAIRI